METTIPLRERVMEAMEYFNGLLENQLLGDHIGKRVLIGDLEKEAYRLNLGRVLEALIHLNRYSQEELNNFVESGVYLPKSVIVGASQKAVRSNYSANLSSTSIPGEDVLQIMFVLIAYSGILKHTRIYNR